MCRFDFDKQEDSYGMTDEKFPFDCSLVLRYELTKLNNNESFF